MTMLSNFRSFLIETYITEAAASSAESADDKGKLHELLLAKYLHPDKQLPEHHRAVSENEDHAGTPVQVHNKLQKKMSPEAYQEIDKAAQGTAKELLSHLKKEGHIQKDKSDIGDVHWTSNRDTATSKGDHEKTTGVKDPNSNADLILTMKNKKGETVGYHGVSAKFGTNKEPNYSNPGMASLEKMSGLESGTISGIMANHHKAMENIGYTGTVDDRHAKYKADIMGIEKIKSEKKRFDTLIQTGKKLPRKDAIMHDNLKKFSDAYDGSKDKEGFLAQAQHRASLAEESGRIARGLAANKVAESMSKKSDKELRDIVTKQISPPTVIPHTVAHSHMQETGSSVPIIHNADDLAKNHLDNFEGLHVIPKSGSAVTIKGYHKDTKKLTNVATFGLKSQSGPHKNVNATLQLK
jgi:hypothetical protein